MLVSAHLRVLIFSLSLVTKKVNVGFHQEREVFVPRDIVAVGVSVTVEIM